MENIAGKNTNRRFTANTRWFDTNMFRYQHVICEDLIRVLTSGGSLVQYMSLPKHYACLLDRSITAPQCIGASFFVISVFVTEHFFADLQCMESMAVTKCASDCLWPHPGLAMKRYNPTHHVIVPCKDLLHHMIMPCLVRKLINPNTSHFISTFF